MANTKSLDLELSSSQYASIADASQTGLDITGDLTIESWIKLESLPGSGADYPIASKWDANGSALSYLFTYQNNSGTYRFVTQLSNSAGTVATAVYNQTLDAGTWYHVAMVVDLATDSVEYFVDGSSIGSGALSAAIADIKNSTAKFAIGARFNNAPAALYDGLIDDVRVWSDKRTPTEIANNRSVELIGNEDNLAGYWKLNDDYLDATANNNDLTAAGSPTFSTDIPFIGNITSELGTGSFTLTGQDINVSLGYSVTLGTGTFVLTGYGLSLELSGWNNPDRNTSSWSNIDRSSSTYSNEARNSASWANRDKS